MPLLDLRLKISVEVTYKKDLVTFSYLDGPEKIDLAALDTRTGEVIIISKLFLNPVKSLGLWGLIHESLKTIDCPRLRDLEKSYNCTIGLVPLLSNGIEKWRGVILVNGYQQFTQLYDTPLETLQGCRTFLQYLTMPPKMN